MPMKCEINQINKPIANQPKILPNAQLFSSDYYSHILDVVYKDELYLFIVDGGNNYQTMINKYTPENPWRFSEKLWEKPNATET